MTKNIHHLLRNFSRSIDKPVLNDPRLDFTPSTEHFPPIGKQTHLESTDKWVWRGVTPLNKRSKIPNKLRLTQIQIAIGTVKWFDPVSQKAIREHQPIRRRAPLFLADASIETIVDPNSPDFERTVLVLSEPPTINHSFVSWLASHGIKAEIDPSAPILKAFHTHDQRLLPIPSEDVHFGIFLSEHARLASSVDPDRNPSILESRIAALLAGEDIAEIQPRVFESRLLSGIRTDQEQQQAILAAMRGENFVLIGPPGCGKTHVIAATIKNLIDQFPNLKIGVASPVEAALNALRRLIGSSNCTYNEYMIGKNRSADPLDLLIVDESSRSTTAEIFPFAAKAKQIIIIGDPNQTPPSPSAPKLHGLDTSLIDLALNNPYFSKYKLSNHYRSYHPDLLAFSNEIIYHGGLLVAPAPQRQINDGLCITCLPRPPIPSSHHSTNNTLEARVLATKLIQSSLDAKSYGISRSRMVVGWTYSQTRLIEATIKNLLKNSNLTEEILSPVKNEPFAIYTASEVQGQERDETWITFGHGIDPKKKKIATASQPSTDMSNNVLKKMNVLLTRSRLATHIYHSVMPQDLSRSDPSPEIMALLALIESEAIDSNTRFQIDPHPEANSVAQRTLRDDPTITNPEAFNLGCVFSVRNEDDPPGGWRYGLFRQRKEWTVEQGKNARALLTAKGWKLVIF